ncbi:peroxisome assembly protein (Peroxin-2) [Umbelopsis sp. WA50703]
MQAPVPSREYVPPWRREWKDIQPTLLKMRRSMAGLQSSPLRVMRVSQLDSDLLDVELFGMLKEQLWSAFSLFNHSFREKFEPELVAVLGFLLYKFSIYDSSASYGSQLQNLKYRNERMHKGALESFAKDAQLTKTQKIMYGVFMVGGQYTWSRMSRLMTTQGWGALDENDYRKKIYEFLQRTEKYWQALSLVNFLVFLYNGKFRTLIDRILSMRLVYAKKSLNRQVSFEFLNRQLVWHAFTEFLLFLMPLINLEKLKLKVSRMLLPKSYLASSQGYDQLPAHQCAICHENSTAQAANSGTSAPIGQAEDLTVHNPYAANCGHLYCYVCLKNKMTLYEGEWACLRCGERVDSMEKHIELVEDEEGDNEDGENNAKDESSKDDMHSSGYMVESGDLHD